MLDCIKSPTASDDCFRRPTASDARLLQMTDCFRLPTASYASLLQMTDCFRRPTASDVRLLQTPDCFRCPTASDDQTPNCFRRLTVPDDRLLQTPDFGLPTAVAAVQSNKQPRSDSGSSAQQQLAPAARRARCRLRAATEGARFHPRRLPGRQQQ